MQDTPKPLKKGYKFPIYPNEAQRTQLEKTFGCCRYVYNRALAESRETYAAYNELLSKGVINPKDRPQVDGYYFVGRITDYKRDEESLWLKEVSNIALQQSMLHLGAAYTRFFRERKGFPRFKKKQSAQSFSLTRNGFTLVGNQLRLAKTDGLIKVAFSRELPSEPSSLTISRTSTCKYYVSFTCEYRPKKTKGQGVIGLDAGISALITTSAGEKIENLKVTKTYAAKLRRVQQAFARKQKGSKNRNRARLKVARLHDHIANQRCDYMHKFMTSVIRENQAVAIENL